MTNVILAAVIDTISTKLPDALLIIPTYRRRVDSKPRRPILSPCNLFTPVLLLKCVAGSECLSCNHDPFPPLGLSGPFDGGSYEGQAEAEFAKCQKRTDALESNVCVIRSVHIWRCERGMIRKQHVCYVFTE